MYSNNISVFFNNEITTHNMPMFSGDLVYSHINKYILKLRHVIKKITRHVWISIIMAEVIKQIIHSHVCSLITGGTLDVHHFTYLYFATL